MNQFTQLLETFLKSNENRTHLRYKTGTFYVRKSLRKLSYSSNHHEKTLNTVFDIGSVDIKINYQNKGYFKLFLLTLSQCNSYEYVYVECVHNQILRNYLVRNGWFTDDHESYYIETELLQALLLKQTNVHS